MCGERVFNLMLESLPKQLDQRPDVAATLDDVRSSMARLFSHGERGIKNGCSPHQFRSRVSTVKRWKMSMMMAMMTVLIVWTLVAWSTRWLMSATLIEMKQSSVWDPFCKDKRSECVLMESKISKAIRQVGSAVHTQCRLFGLEGAMSNPEQIREKVLALETVLLRQDPLAIPQVHESTVAAMSLIGDPAGNVCKVHIYTDGSFKEAAGDAAQEAGWAFVVILEHACTEYSFHGFTAGTLAVGSERVRPLAWVSATKAGCDTAELAAITWACRWCIYHMCVESILCGLSVILHVDSQYAIYSVEGHARLVVNEEAVHYASAAKCILETFSMVTVEWIAGHIGHPWNELADAAAKQAARNPEMSATRHFGNVDPLLSHRQLDWFFLSRLAPNDRMQYPTIVDGAFSVTNHEETLSNSDVATLLESAVQNVGAGNGSCTDMVSLRVATANVNTLSPSDESVDGPTLAVTGRILALQSQFAQCGLQMVGIQEGRMRNSALRMCPDYFCLVTPANASGCFGCELWVSTAIP